VHFAEAQRGFFRFFAGSVQSGHVSVRNRPETNSFAL
jgi:hypothetical protein